MLGSSGEMETSWSSYLIRIPVQVHFIFEDGEVVKYARVIRLDLLSPQQISESIVHMACSTSIQSEAFGCGRHSFPRVRIGRIRLQDLFVQIAGLIIVSERLKVLSLQQAILLRSRRSRLASRHHCDHKKSC